MLILETIIMEIAQRIKALREILNLSSEQMAEYTELSVDTYLEYESGHKDFGFTFLYECARIFGVDIVELLTGEKPKLSRYAIVRAGKGLPIRRREGFTYEHLAYRIHNKLFDPLFVTVPYLTEAQEQPMQLSRHKGQEFICILNGSLKIQLDEHIEVLGKGDSIFFDSGLSHGMIAVGGIDCTLLAVISSDSETDKTY